MSEHKLDFEGLAQALLGHVRELLPVWLPGGKMQGHEYCCANQYGGNGSSFSVNVNTGRWADFASNDVKGGDLISLFALIQGIKQGEAARQLSDSINFKLKPEPVKAAMQNEILIGKPPAKELAPMMNHPRFGKPSNRWCYRNSEGDHLFYTARYDPPGEDKQFTWSSWDRSNKRWKMIAYPEPRPVYGLDRLSARPTAPVLIVEGEKACDAARSLADKVYVVVSWPGGAAAWRKVDWRSLSGRRVLLWPDADRHKAKTEGAATAAGVELGATMPLESQPGYQAMLGIAAVLLPICQEVKLIEVGLDEERKDGWDAADAVAGGWEWPQFKEWAVPRATLLAPPDKPVKRPEPEKAVVAEIVKAEERIEQPSMHLSVNVPAPDEVAAPDVPDSLYAAWEKLGIATSSSGAAVCNQDNALRVLEGHEDFKDLIWYDEFHKRFFTRFDFKAWKPGHLREWADIDELNLTAYMQRNLGLRRMSDGMIHNAAMVLAHKNVRNEPRDWFDSLVWDKTPRVEKFFIDCFGAEDSEHTRAASKNFLIGTVARIYDPGCQLDNMVVLEGPQGIGKTRALRILGGIWYTDAHESVTSKDFFMVLHGRLIVEIAELDSFGRAEVTRIKQVVSCATDRYRSPYARSAQDHKRMSVFVGTTNERQYLRDHTGGRRFWPILCGKIDAVKIKEDREQLFAEAVAMFRAGSTWYEMPAMTAEAQESRRQHDEWENVIADILTNKAGFATTREIAYALKIDMAQLDMQVQRRIANIMRALGWEKCKARIDDRPQNAWKRTSAAVVAAPDQEEIPF